MIRIISRKPVIVRDERGATLVEFGFVLPVFLLLTMGIFDIAYVAYTRSVLQGAVNAAARNSTLEQYANNTAAVDAAVLAEVARVNRNATITFTRSNYESFNRIDIMEDFTDTDRDGIRDAGECFDDENTNGIHDRIAGRSGQGGANDVVLYTATMSMPRVFPFWQYLNYFSRLDNDSANNTNETSSLTMQVTTTLRNQPYGTQAARGGTQVCT